MSLHKPIAALNALLKTGYCVVDGICGDLSFEEGGTPLTANDVTSDDFKILVEHTPYEILLAGFPSCLRLAIFYHDICKPSKINCRTKIFVSNFCHNLLCNRSVNLFYNS